MMSVLVKKGDIKKKKKQQRESFVECQCWPREIPQNRPSAACALR